MFFLPLWLASCASIPTPAERREHADRLASASGWQAVILPAGAFDLLSYLPVHHRQETHLTVYIEGDGFAWASPRRPSDDPTPREPLALRLALAHPGGNAAYLARPCQFVRAKRAACLQRYWTQARYAEDVVVSIRLAIDQLKRRFGAQRLTLVGYSGGAAVAALVAQRSGDVGQLITVAGNLDHAGWSHHHRLDPLAESLNPADHADKLAGLAQIHFIGGSDAVIPPDIAYRWPLPFRGRHDANLRVIEGYDHRCCWSEHWPQHYEEAVTQKRTQ